MEKSIYHSCVIYNSFKQLNLCCIFFHTTIKYVMAILISVFSLGYKGKTVNFSIEALKTNQVIYPVNIRMSIREFASHLRSKSLAVRLVTVNKHRYYVYHYEGRLNDGVEGVVLITYPQRGVPQSKCLACFLMPG